MVTSCKLNNDNIKEFNNNNIYTMEDDNILENDNIQAFKNDNIYIMENNNIPYTRNECVNVIIF